MAREDIPRLRVAPTPTRAECIEWMYDVVRIVGKTYHPDNKADEYEPSLPDHLDESNETLLEVLGNEAYEIGLVLITGDWGTGFLPEVH